MYNVQVIYNDGRIETLTKLTEKLAKQLFNYYTREMHMMAIKSVSFGTIE